MSHTPVRAGRRPAAILLLTLCLAWPVLAGLRLQSDATAARGPTHLFAIGADFYETWPALPAAQAEIQLWQDQLLARYRLEAANVVTLSGRLATRNTILGQLEIYRDRLGPDDALLLLFAGRAQVDDRSGEIYWLPANAGLDRRRRDNWLACRELAAALQALPARQILLLADAPFPAALLPGAPAAAPAGTLLRDVLVSNRQPVGAEPSPFARALAETLATHWQPQLSSLDLARACQAAGGEAPLFGGLAGTSQAAGSPRFTLFLDPNKVAPDPAGAAGARLLAARQRELAAPAAAPAATPAPAAAPAAARPEERIPSCTYRVQPGDTWGSLGLQSNLGIARLKAMNHLSGSDLQPGQMLLVQAPGEPASGQPWRVPGLDLLLAPLAPGSFRQGSYELPGAAPPHEVRLTRPFWLGYYEVTQREFAAFVAATGYQTTAERSGSVQAWRDHRWTRLPGQSWRSLYVGLTRPALGLSWTDAAAFCTWLDQREQAEHRVPAGYQYRLPTEAEWEYACRAGAATRYPWGDQAAAGVCNVANDRYGEGANRTLFASAGLPDHGPLPVGSFRANAWDLYDLLGNAAEWCRDWHAAYPPAAVADPAGPLAGSTRVLRGGAWNYALDACEPAQRRPLPPGEAYEFSGFRVALAPALR